MSAATRPSTCAVKGVWQRKYVSTARGVYLDFLKEIHARVTARGRRMAFWGDIIMRHLVREVPCDA